MPDLTIIVYWYCPEKDCEYHEFTDGAYVVAEDGRKRCPQCNALLKPEQWGV